MTIKVRMMLWYTTLIVILLGMFIPFVYFTMSQFMYGSAESFIKSDAAQAVSMVDIEDNTVKVKESSDFHLSGTYIAIYDTKNHLLFDNSHQSWISSISPLYEKVRKISRFDGTWLIYDQKVYNDTTAIAWIRAVRPLKPVTDTLQNLKTIILVAIPIYLIIAVLGGLFISGRALSPISQISQTAREIGHGDLSKRIRLANTKDEVGRLAETFNEMLDRLEAAFAREKQFASDASHELRTPITVISAHAEETLTGSKSISDYQESMETILKESRKMGSMVAQLLMLTRGYEGKYRLEMEEISLSTTIQGVVDEMTEYADRVGVQILLFVDADIRVKADQTLITRMLVNLVENAVKYNKEGGWVHVKLKKKNDFASIIIEDNGIGMNREHLPYIFNRFYRAEQSRSGKGTGLGLSIVKWIVEAHKGSISVNSKPGSGTCFEIRLKSD